MLLLRVFLILYSVAAFTFVIYRLIQIGKTDNPHKTVILVTGIILLILPAATLFNFVRPTWHYVLIYPVALSLFLYMVKTR